MRPGIDADGGVCNGEIPQVPTYMIIYAHENKPANAKRSVDVGIMHVYVLVCARMHAPVGQIASDGETYIDFLLVRSPKREHEE